MGVNTGLKMVWACLFAGVLGNRLVDWLRNLDFDMVEISFPPFSRSGSEACTSSLLVLMNSSLVVAQRIIDLKFYIL